MVAYSRYADRGNLKWLIIKYEGQTDDNFRRRDWKLGVNQR